MDVNCFILARQMSAIFRFFTISNPTDLTEIKCNWRKTLKRFRKNLNESVWLLTTMKEFDTVSFLRFISIWTTTLHQMSFYSCAQFELTQLNTVFLHFLNLLFSLLPTAYVVRGKVMFSVCLWVHTRGGGYLPSGWGGVPNFPGLDGGVPTFPGPDGGVSTFPG